MKNELVGFRSEIEKLGIETADILGLLGGGYLGSKASKKVTEETAKGIGDKILKTKSISGPIAGGILGLLLAKMLFGKKQSEVGQTHSVPQGRLRRLTVPGATNVYGAPTYMPRY